MSHIAIAYAEIG